MSLFKKKEKILVAYGNHSGFFYARLARTPLIIGMTSNRISTAANVYNTPALLKNVLHALERVLLVMVEHFATFAMLLSKVIAMKPPRTMTAMLIMLLKSTISVHLPLS